MYFTRKKTTIQSSLFHLEEMTIEQKHNHLLEIFKLGLDSINSITQPKSAMPVHFVIPVIYNQSISDELLFTINRSNILSDVFGMTDTNSGMVYPRIVMDNLFSEEVREGIKDYIHSTGLTGKSVFRRPKDFIRATSKHRIDNILPLENLFPSNITRLIDGTRVGQRTNMDKHLMKYAVSTNYGGKAERKETEKSDEFNIISRLKNKTNHPIKKTVVPNDKFPTNLMTVEYCVSLSEIGELIVQLIKMFKRGGYYRTTSDSEMDVYSYKFTDELNNLFAFNNTEHAFVNVLCKRLGIEDETIKNNMLTYVFKRMSSSYEDTIRQFNSFQLSKEKTMLDSETIVNPANTFVSVTFFIYFKTHSNLLNKPDQIVAYNYNLTRVNNLHGRAGSYTNNCPVDNYKHTSYLTTINTTILPTHLTNFVLKSKMSDLQKMQQYMEVPKTDFLSTQYNNTYLPIKEDFIIYDDTKVKGIVNMLSSWVNIRFDKNIQVSYFPEFPSQYPLSLYSYRNFAQKTFEKYFKETFFEYIGIEIDYSKPISTYLKTIDDIFESLKVLDTDTEILISKEFKDYVYTWLIVLYLHNNILFKYRGIGRLKSRISEFLSALQFPEEMRGGWRNEFLGNHWDYYRTYANTVAIYPMLVEVVYAMLQKSTPEELCMNLKTTLLPSVEAESKAQIATISKLYNIEKQVISWETKDKELRKELANNEFSQRSKFIAIERLLYNQFAASTRSVALKSFTNDEYDSLLKHILIGIKSFHYFTSLRNCFVGFLSSSDPNSYISHHFKTITHAFKEEYSNNEVFELSQIVYQYSKKYPKTIFGQPSNLKIDTLIEWYKDIHLTFDIETF